MNKLSICFAGLSRQEEASIIPLFKQANAQHGDRWLVTPETEAGVLVIDMDSMYGQMSLMKALGTGKTLVALTAGSRADTDHILARPVTAAGLSALLGAIESGTTPNTNLPAADIAPAAAAVAPPAPSAPVPAPAFVAPTPTPPALTPAPADDSAARITTELPAAPPAPAPAPASIPAPFAAPAPAPAAPVAPARNDRQLSDFLRAGALQGPVRLQRGDAPELVLDPATQTYLGGAALKPLLPYCHASLTDADFTGVSAGELPALEARLGGRHPFARLAWLCALTGGSGALMPGYGPNEKYKLLKWPQTEREYPKHFRIATVMMKGPALLIDIAEASGVGLDEVIDYVNASLAVGVAEQDSSSPATTDPGKGGLLGRFRR